MKLSGDYLVCVSRKEDIANLDKQLDEAWGALAQAVRSHSIVGFNNTLMLAKLIAKHAKRD